jgi:hypothetical protein
MLFILLSQQSRKPRNRTSWSHITQESTEPKPNLSQSELHTPTLQQHYITLLSTWINKISTTEPRSSYYKHLTPHDQLGSSDFILSNGLLPDKLELDDPLFLTPERDATISSSVEIELPQAINIIHPAKQCPVPQFVLTSFQELNLIGNASSVPPPMTFSLLPSKPIFQPNLEQQSRKHQCPSPDCAWSFIRPSLLLKHINSHHQDCPVAKKYLESVSQE